MRSRIERTSIYVSPNGIAEIKQNKHKKSNTTPIISSNSISKTDIIPDDSGRNIMSIKTLYWDGKTRRVTSIGNINRVNTCIIGDGRLLDRLESQITNLLPEDKYMILNLWNQLLSEEPKKHPNDIDIAVAKIIVKLLSLCCGNLYYLSKKSADVGYPFGMIDINLDINSEEVPICRELIIILGSMWSRLLELYNNIVNTNIKVGIIWLKIYAITYQCLQDMLISIDSDWSKHRNNVCNIMIGISEQLVNCIETCSLPYKQIMYSTNTQEESSSNSEDELSNTQEDELSNTQEDELSNTQEEVIELENESDSDY